MAVYVEWKPYYSVGHAELDAEHRQILGILDDLYAAMQQAPNAPATAELWKRLLQYTNTHFRHEERVMREHDYPDLAEHAALHVRLRQRTADFQAHFETWSPPATCSALSRSGGWNTSRGKTRSTLPTC